MRVEMETSQFSETVTSQLRITGVKDFDSKDIVKAFSDFWPKEKLK